MTLPVYAVLPELGVDISRVLGQFQELEKDTLACGLGLPVTSRTWPRNASTAASNRLTPAHFSPLPVEPCYSFSIIIALSHRRPHVVINNLVKAKKPLYAFKEMFKSVVYI
jgi:hypothetical protein